MGLGHWRRADQLLMEGNDLLEERCTGCAWELSQAHVCDVYSLVQLGQLREAASRGSRWLRGAQEIGDLYGKTSLEIHLTAPTLAADQGEAAAAQLQETVSGWSKEQFTPQHLLAVTDAAKCELYRGNAAAAWNVIDGAWKAAEHSMGWQFTRVMAFYFHAGAAVALARQQPSERERLLAVARQEAQVVHQEGRHYARGVAGILRAGVAMTEGQPEAALRELEEAIAGFTEAEMTLHAACARRRKGELLGGDRGLSLIAEADGVMEAQGIRKPQQWADMYAPGFRGS
jgi:eukaryotic-like serine/threonine-protein kinase